MFPDEMVTKYSEQESDMRSDATSLNQHEEQFLIDQMNKAGLETKSIHYHKIWAVEEGKKFEKRIKDYANKDLVSIVVNFVDILAHKSSQMDVLNEDFRRTNSDANNTPSHFQSVAADSEIEFCLFFLSCLLKSGNGILFCSNVLSAYLWLNC